MSRIWPSRFVDAATASSQDAASEHQSYYLIGLSWHSTPGSGPTKDEAKAAEITLQSLLHDFETRMRNDDKYYDAGTCWLSAAVTNTTDVSNAVPDPGYLEGEGAGDSGDSDDDDDDRDILEEEEESETDLSTEGEEFPKATKSRRSKKEKLTKLNVPTTAKPPGMGKFRSATDVMNRLRWDQGMDETNYMVGFEDRFTGAQEKALVQWKTEQTDEEFIPQHRILYFKRKSDGVVVWERKTRVDRIFGSGVISE
jgi:uncharacterized protein (UPF0248 family)